MRVVKVAAEIAAAVMALSRHRCDALIAWDPAFEVEGGIVLGARVHHHLLVTIHAPDPMNTLRTGITIVRSRRIERAAVPIEWTDLVERAGELGTGIAIAIDNSGEIRWLDRTGHVDTSSDADAIARVLHRRALRIQSR